MNCIEKWDIQRLQRLAFIFLCFSIISYIAWQEYLTEIVGWNYRLKGNLNSKMTKTFHDHILIKIISYLLIFSFMYDLILDINNIKSTWKSVKGMKAHETLVYSAYYDIREVNEPIIRVIGVTRVKSPERLLCKIYYTASDVKLSAHEIESSTNTNFDKIIDVPAIISILPDHNNHEYHSCYIFCPLNDIKFRNLKSNLIPRAVSIIPLLSVERDYSNRLAIMNSQNGGTGTYQATTNKVGLCIKPVHSNYSDWFELISFIELQRILGVSRIIVYNESMSDNVSCILRYYDEQEHLVTVMAWDLYEKSDIRVTSSYNWFDKRNNLRNRGALASLNDCFHRYMNEYQYLFSVDLDEFIIPHIHDTIPEMLEYLKSTTDVNYLQSHKKQRKVINSSHKNIDFNVTSSYNFVNSFFYQHYGNILISKQSLAQFIKR